jgi:hypothetical protein
VLLAAPGGRTLVPVPGSEVRMLGTLSALIGYAAWQTLAPVPGGAPSGLMVLAAVALSAALIALLARSASNAAGLTRVPVTPGMAALRERSWRAGFVPQRDPDAPGRARPRAPSAGPAAA